MEALLQHERKSSETAKIVIPGHNNNEDSSSGSEDSVKVVQHFMEPGKINSFSYIQIHVCIITCQGTALKMKTRTHHSTIKPERLAIKIMERIGQM